MGIAQRKRKIGQSNKVSDRLRGSVNTKRSDKRGSEFASVKPLILERDNFTCCRCGRQNHPSKPTNLVLTVDHKIPVAQGGTNRPSNLETICNVCHSKKPGKANKRGSHLLLSLKRDVSSTGRSSSWRDVE